MCVEDGLIISNPVTYYSHCEKVTQNPAVLAIEHYIAERLLYSYIVNLASVATI